MNCPLDIFRMGIVCQWKKKKFQDGYWAILSSCCGNKNDIYLELGEFHSVSQRPVLCMLEGRDRKGWEDLVSVV